MASVSSSHLILFIASMLIAASVAGTFTQGVQRISASLGDRSLDVSTEVRTDVDIISDPGSGAVANDEAVTVLVKNTGSEDLDASAGRIDVLVDGQYRTGISVTVVDGSTWAVGNVVRIRVPVSLSPGDHRVSVVVDGDEEVLEFRL